MKKMKLVLLSFLILTIAIGGSGCMKSNSKGFVSYLENKYPNDKFEFVDFEGGTLFGGDTLKVSRCTSQILSGCEIYVVYDRNEKKYSDNYLDMKYSNETDNAISNVFNTAFQNEEFHFITAEENFYATTKSNSLDRDTDFAAYKNSRGIPIYAFVTNNAQKTHDKIVSDLEKTIIGEGLYCNSVDIYILDDFDSDLENNDSLQNDIVINNKYADHLFATMSNSLGFDSVEWENE